MSIQTDGSGAETTEEKNTPDAEELETKPTEGDQGGKEEETKESTEEQKQQNREGYQKRKTDTPELEVPEEKATPTDPLTKEDLAKQNRRDAVREMTTALDGDDESTVSMKQSILENWEGVKEFYKNTSKSDIPTVSEVKRDLTVAFQVWSANNPEKAGNAAAALATSAGAKGGAKVVKTEAPKKRLIPKQEGMSSWYPKKD